MRRFTVEDVGRIFSVPAFLLGDPTRSTYASAKESGRQFAMQALAPWVAKLQRAFSASVLAPQFRLADRYVAACSRPIRAERWASWQKARQAGVLTPNEVRREEGWPASSDPNADSIAPPPMSRADRRHGRADRRAAAEEGAEWPRPRLSRITPPSLQLSAVAAGCRPDAERVRASWARPSSSTSTRCGRAAATRARPMDPRQRRNMLATIERLYGFALSGGDPDETSEFFSCMAWLPRLVRDIERGGVQLDG